MAEKETPQTASIAMQAVGWAGQGGVQDVCLSGIWVCVCFHVELLKALFISKWRLT